MANLDGVFENIRAAYLAHDPGCISLRHMWLGRRGGVTDLGAIDDCADCGVTFYTEGIPGINWDEYDADKTGDLDLVRLCGCCAQSRGITLVETEYGVSVAA